MKIYEFQAYEIFTKRGIPFTLIPRKGAYISESNR
jgi:succinyl-CoA synthetase beta subunit